MKKAEKLLILVILCLCGYLIYDVYQPQAHNDKNKWGDTLILSGQADFIQEEIPLSETEKRVDQIREEQLPSAYDGRNAGRAPRVKDQLNLGTCWAMTTSSALEAALLPEERRNFSPDHISMQNGYAKSQKDGGAYTMAMAYLASWTGPVLEKQDPYGDGVSPTDLSPVKHVQEMQMFMGKEFEQMKRAIYEYGAVQASIYMDMQGNQSTSVYYKEETNAYCYTGQEEPNHDVLLIGWDDDYPAENFSSGVKEDGAFICQNSWGTSFGEQGVFYISYEDVHIGENCVAYTRIDAADNYEKIYQTDLCGWVGQVGYDSETCWFANVYRTGEKAELVKAVAFYATGPNTEYEIWGVSAFTGTGSLKEAQIIQAGSFENAGYYTVDLKNSMEISKEQDFAILVKIKTPGEPYPVATEYQADENTKFVDISDGTGYISLDGRRWTNTEETYQCNLCLKVFTDSK